MRTRLLLTFLAPTVLGIAFANASLAATLFWPCSNSLTTMTVTQSSPTTTGSLTCAQFNPALGKLTGAAYLAPFAFTVEPGSYFTITNPSAATVTYPTGTTVWGPYIALTFGGFTDGVTTFDSTPLTNQNAGDTFLPGSSVTIATSGSFGSFPSPLVLGSSDFSALTGTGTFLVDISASSAALTGLDAQPPLTLTDYSAIISSTLDSQMVYTYTPIPEPCDALLMAAGFGLILWPRLRKFNQ